MCPTHHEEPLSVNLRLVFDLGAHVGGDTISYLEQAYRVVAVEPHPQCAEALKEHLKPALDRGALRVVQKAIVRTPGESARLWCANDPAREIHTTELPRDGLHSQCLSDIPGVTMQELIAEAGAVPYYVKCDIEGADAIPLLQLEQMLLEGSIEKAPPFFSAELHSERADVFDIPFAMYACGYRKFQFVDQLAVRRVYGPGRSGPFGKALPQGNWVDFPDVLNTIGLMLKFPAASGDSWFDLHAATCRGFS